MVKAFLFEIVSCVSKAGDNEETRNKKQARIRQMESLMKELEGLLKQDGKAAL